MPASASAWFLRSRSEKRLARPLGLQVFFSGCHKVPLQDVGLGIRAGSSIQIRETAREAARPPGVFSGCRKFQLEGCWPRHPRGFFDPVRRNGSRGRSPSKSFFRLPQSSTGGMPASASAGGASIQNGETAREAARPPCIYFRLPQSSTGGMPASASAVVSMSAYADPATKDPAKPRCPMRDRRFRGSQ